MGNTTAPGGYVPAGWSAWLANGGGSYIAPQFATHGLMAAAGIADGAIQLSSAPANYSTRLGLGLVSNPNPNRNPNPNPNQRHRQRVDGVDPAHGRERAAPPLLRVHRAQGLA